MPIPQLSFVCESVQDVLTGADKPCGLCFVPASSPPLVTGLGMRAPVLERLQTCREADFHRYVAWERNTGMCCVSHQPPNDLRSSDLCTYVPRRLTKHGLDHSHRLYCWTLSVFSDSACTPIRPVAGVWQRWSASGFIIMSSRGGHF